MSVSIDDVRAAASRLDGRIRHTPVLRADDGVWFKLEHTQHAGSFKTRGMFNQILAAGALPAAGIVAASGGNAGLAAAYAARELGVRAEVFVPLTAPAVKVAKLGKLGAHVVQVGNEYAEAYEAALARASTTGALFCHAYDDPAMVAGNGTLGLDLLDQIPAGFDTVLVAVGGGGLIAGVLAALGPTHRVVAVEPSTASALHSALQAGAPVDVPVSGVAADSLGARRVGRIAFEMAAGIDSVLVDDQAIVDARRRLWDDYRLAVEHGTAAAFAALTSGAYAPAPGERVVVLLCGANTNPADLA
ncbi:threonine/serine dehydratase [Paractinoplanes brasiliensis]|uniref:Threonine dehydratase n=1 Tax=Paractinoplanes brasiliensis TaxID=52695 RepID=A0A4R6JSD2_9ACTN|nr:threonine/serine dehydratase [Actinoplanes brasiliensis]TDO37876.1 threonine dehydratase [Actinoplanes brasiliensis]GID32987.1 threonine dehydratase [Actinoplanes brasiliensis]